MCYTIGYSAFGSVHAFLEDNVWRYCIKHRRIIMAFWVLDG